MDSQMEEISVQKTTTLTPGQQKVTQIQCHQFGILLTKKLRNIVWKKLQNGNTLVMLFSLIRNVMQTSRTEFQKVQRSCQSSHADFQRSVFREIFL